MADDDLARGRVSISVDFLATKAEQTHTAQQQQHSNHRPRCLACLPCANVAEQSSVAKSLKPCCTWIGSQRVQVSGHLPFRLHELPMISRLQICKIESNGYVDITIMFYMRSKKKITNPLSFASKGRIESISFHQTKHEQLSIYRQDSRGAAHCKAKEIT